MRLLLNFVIVVFVLVTSLYSVAGEELKPFWRKNEKLYKQMKERRKVVVSSELIKRRQGKDVKIMGAGVVNVPLYFAVEQVMRFEDLTQVSSYFKTVKHRKAKQEVFYFIQAMGLQVRMVQKYKWGSQGDKHAQLDWLVLSGTMKGMEGHYRFDKVSPRQTEVSVWASQKNVKWPVPDFMVNFTLEVIAEKTAQKMRNFLEDSYRQRTQRGISNGK